MSKAQKRSAALTEMFWFRKNITSVSKATNINVSSSNEDATCTLMSINEIINGKVKHHIPRAPIIGVGWDVF